MIPSLFVLADQKAVDLPPLHVKGPQIIDAKGKPVILRGCNLGGWFVTENWIWDQNQAEGGPGDQFSLEALFTERFGAKETDRLMRLYRDSWITERDFKIIQSFRFNCVRLPMNYRTFEDDANPYHLKPDAWTETDRVIRLAGKYGLYVILDMHGAQGGQSPYDHTGHSNQNKLWSDPENSKRLAWLWSQIAHRYRNNGTVAAYDVMNEPYGGEFASIKKVFQESYQAIRKEDPEKLIWAMGRYDSFEFYGSPKANNWHNVGYQMHYYPGMFGNGSPTVRNLASHLAFVKRDLMPKVKAFYAPFLVGEMNVVFKKAGGADMMRHQYDLYGSQGWATTMWTYKVLSQKGGIGDGSWGMVTNKSPFRPLDFRTASLEAIEKWMKSHATMPYQVYSELKAALAPVKSPAKPIPAFPKRPLAPQDSLEGWKVADIGGALKGGLKVKGAGFELFGGGLDIWGTKDQFRFLYQPVEGDFELTTQVISLEDLGTYCKAGLMVRSSLDPASPVALVSAFPSADLQFAVRERKGGDMVGNTAVASEFPVVLKITRKGQEIIAEVKIRGGNWKEVGRTNALTLPNLVYAGVIALSHDNGELVKASYTNLSLRRITED